MIKDILLYLCLVVVTISFLLLSSGVLYLGNKLLLLCRAALNVWESKQTDRIVSSVQNTENPIGKESRQTPRVEEIPPEYFESTLKKPPRPAGGFGSSVGNPQSAPQIQPRNRDKATDQQS